LKAKTSRSPSQSAGSHGSLTANSLTNSLNSSSSDFKSSDPSAPTSPVVEKKGKE